MKRFGLYIIILNIGLLLVGCHDRLVLPEEQTQTEAERTVIVYIAGDNSLSSAIQKDTAEMAKGKDLIPEDVNFIIFIDDNNKKNKPAIYQLSAKNGMQLWKQFDDELCSTDAGTMLETLQGIESHFPARHYGITFWSHASGWVPERKFSRRNTFGKDENVGITSSGETEMDIPVMQKVLAQLPKSDYLFFDACFMQSIEVAYELREVTNYMVGSPAEIPGPGAPYHLIIDALCKGDANGIVEGYGSGYPDGIYPGVLLSCIDCTQLNALAQKTGQLLIPFYNKELDQPSTSGFLPYCNDPTWHTHLTKYTYCYDMCTTMYNLLSEREEDYAAWMELFDRAVPLRIPHSSGSWFANFCSKPTISHPECYGGVSMFLPLEEYNDYGWNEEFKKTSWYKATGWQATGW